MNNLDAIQQQINDLELQRHRIYSGMYEADSLGHMDNNYAGYLRYIEDELSRLYQEKRITRAGNRKPEKKQKGFWTENAIDTRLSKRLK